MGKPKGNKGPANKGNKANKDKMTSLSNIKKTKTKAVSSNLKKLNLQTKAKTEKADETFKAVREAVMASTKPAKPLQVSKRTKPPTASTSAVDMEVTTESFAKL